MLFVDVIFPQKICNVWEDDVNTFLQNLNIYIYIFPRKPAFVLCYCRVLRDINSEPLVESVHLYPAAGQDHVHALGGRSGRGRARQAAAPHADALRQSVRAPDPALRQHGCLQEIPHHGSRRRSR